MTGIIESFPLLGPEDHHPVTVLNETGRAHVLLTGDQVSNAIPKQMKQLALDDWVLKEHVACDIGTYKLITHLFKHLDAPAVLAGYSRLIIDVNRSLENPSAIPETSDNILFCYFPLD